MKLKVMGIHENSPSQATSKTDSKNPFAQAQNKMKENSKDKNNGKFLTFGIVFLWRHICDVIGDLEKWTDVHVVFRLTFVVFR